MHSIKVLICVLIFITLVSSQTDYKILYSEFSENMKDHAIGITLVAINEKVNNTELAKRLRTGFNKEYGPEWVSLVGHNLTYDFKQSPNTVFWFSFGDLQILLFKPGFKAENDFISDARKTNAVLTVVKNEMTEAMKEHAIVISLISLKNHNDFKSISANISSSLELLYGHHWVSSISISSSQITSGYIKNTFISMTVEEIQITIFQISIPDNKLNFMDIIREASASEPTSLSSMGENLTDIIKNTIVQVAKEELKNAVQTCNEKTCTYATLSNALRISISNKLNNMPVIICGIRKYLGDSNVTFISLYAFDFGQIRCMIEFYKSFK